MAANNPSDAYPYKEVHCLIFLWENDDLGVRKGLEALQKVFIETLNFSSARIHTISSRNSYDDVESSLSEMKRAGKHLVAGECLFIVVYGGHGAVNFQSRLVWSGVHPDINTITPNKKTRLNPQVDWSALQVGLELSMHDALVILDCCMASGSPAFIADKSHKESRTEILAACGFDKLAAAGGAHEFTALLTKTLCELRDIDEQAHSVAQIHSILLSRMNLHHSAHDPYTRKHVCSECEKGNKFTTPVLVVLTPDHNKPSIPIKKLSSWASAPSVSISRPNHTSTRDENSYPVVVDGSGGWSNVAATSGQNTSGWGNQLTAVANTSGWNTSSAWDTTVDKGWENGDYSLSNANNNGGWGDSNNWDTTAKFESKIVDSTARSCLEQLQQKSTVTIGEAFLCMGNPHRSVKSSRIEERFILLYKWASDERKNELTAAIRTIALDRKNFDLLTCAYLYETLESKQSKTAHADTCWYRHAEVEGGCSCMKSYPTNAKANNTSASPVNPSNSAAATAASSPKSTAPLSPTKTVHWNSPTNATTGWNSPTPIMAPISNSPPLNHSDNHKDKIKDKDEKNWDKIYEQLFLSEVFTPKQLWKSSTSGFSAREKVRDLAEGLMEMAVGDSEDGGKKGKVVDERWSGS